MAGRAAQALRRRRRVRPILQAEVGAIGLRHSALPGFGLSLGFATAYLGLIVLLPLAGLLAKAGTMDAARAWAVLSDPRTVSAFRVSFLTSAAAALLSIPLGVLLAWVLERYHVPGRRLLDAAIDLPFALPTAVAGIALTTLYVADGWLGRWLDPFGITVAFTPLGIGAALLFIGVPFVVRTVQPVLAGVDRAAEEAAMVLGATPVQIFGRVILPTLAPSIATGAALAFARAVGEYGSVIFIAGNRPGVSEIVPLLIVIKLEQFDYPGAALLGAAMLALSLVLLLAINGLQNLGRPRGAA
ncbi:MAG: sulfate ABC transporter permease subunit CysT [Gemmatimonadaceae bacterium]|nr:sulfate ABC transporter permease subunit CysT [Acetobacteraceae bacterium]